MNYGAFVQLPRTQSPPLSSSAIKMLLESAHQQLPLQFHMSSTTTEKDFVLYSCIVYSATTRSSWSVSYRYSEFSSFSHKVEEHWTSHDDTCSGSCEAIREYVSACFPKKRLAVMSSKPSAIADRKSKFENVLMHLLRCVLLPGSAMKCFHARQNLPSNLFAFLAVKDEADPLERFYR